LEAVTRPESLESRRAERHGHVCNTMEVVLVSKRVF
jgi:hypothetical protein